MSQVLIQSPCLHGLSQAGPCKDTKSKRGGAQASKTKLHLRKMKPKQSKPRVVAAGFPLSQCLQGAVLYLHATLTQIPTPADPIANPAGGHLPFCFPKPHFTVFHRSLTTLVEGTRISPLALAHLPPRVAQGSHIPGTGAARMVLSH